MVDIIVHNATCGGLLYVIWCLVCKLVGVAGTEGTKPNLWDLFNHWLICYESWSIKRINVVAYPPLSFLNNTFLFHFICKNLKQHCLFQALPHWVIITLWFIIQLFDHKNKTECIDSINGEKNYRSKGSPRDFWFWTPLPWRWTNF